MDHIKNLLSQTGWSYEELLQKLSEFKHSSPIKVESSTSGAQHQLNNVASAQEIKEYSPCSSADVILQLNCNEESKNLKESKCCSPCNADSSSTQAHENQQGFNAKTNHKLINDKDKSQTELKRCSSSGNVAASSTSSTEPSNKKEQNENQLAFKKCLSSRQEDHQQSNKEEEDFEKCKINLNSTEAQHNLNDAKENDLKISCNDEAPSLLEVNNVEKENRVPPENQLETPDYKSKNKEVDASDHNYIKKTNNKDCNLTDCCERNDSKVTLATHAVLSQENCTNRSESVKITSVSVTKRKIVNFKSRFLYRIKRSCRIRCRQKNVKRSQLIPRQSRRNKEGVRNQILQQLELLRNRRSSDFGRNLHQTIAPGLAEPLLYKKRLSNEKVKNESSTSATTTESINRLEEEVTTAQEPWKSNNDNLIKPTKTNDITKIKGWKHKKFASLVDLNATKNCNLVSVPSTASCSYKDKSNEDITCEKQETNEPVTSAFASNNLDGFLYDSADLQISFQIPKLASGEDYSNSTPPVVTNIANPIKLQNEPEDEDQDENIESAIINGDRENLLKIHKITNLYKPRTVAQRRRIWRLKDDARIKQDESTRKPRTLAEKRRLMDVSEDSKNFPLVKRSSSETNFFDEDLKYSYVLFRGKKIRVPTFTEKGIIAYIKYSYNKKEYIYVPKKRKMSSNKNKPSIFNINSIMKSDAIKYRPGPLCKKLQLQEENKSWRTVIKKLPKVYLEVTPEMRKPIHPCLLHLLPDYQFELTVERVEFALSALYDKKLHSNKVTFKFPVAYANHEESLLFREKIKPEDVKPDLQQEGEMLMTDVIKDVVNKMLDYVETKDVADEIFIKEDVHLRCKDEEIPVSSTTKTNPKKRKKKSKTNYELKRLNVKVIEVDLEDKGGDIINCNKEYCKLGCICKSLATTSSLVSNHCGIPDCMFECTCNYNRKTRGNLKITLPVGIDVLSEGAVSRLEDEAKKNLAKVEKEFTQTVIQANNQTIVVGGHCNRQRRLTKAPRKYNDFIDDPDFLLENENEPEEISEPLDEVQPQIEWKPCFVKVPRLKLQQLIPFCLVHNLHNCHCDYKAQFKVMPITENKIKNNVEPIVQNASEESIPKPSPNLECQSSARIRGISTSYYLVRNRTREFISTRKKKLERLYKEYLQTLYMGDDDIDVYVHSEVELSKLKEKDENVEVDDDKQISKGTRRKQQLTVREDTITLQAIKKPELKKKEKPKQKIKPKQIAKPDEKKSVPPEPKPADENKQVIAEAPPKTTVSPSELNNVVKDETLPKFENLLLSNKHTTELLTPSTAVRKKFLQLLGKKNECDAQFRLIPWSGLASRYETNKLQLWYSTYYKVPKIIVSDSIVVPKHFINVKQFENIQDKSLIKVDLIRWLVMKTVPGGKCSDDVLVILQLTKTHCEVCGICEKTCINAQSTENMLLALIPSFLTQNKNKEGTETIEVNNLFNFDTVDEQKKQHVIAKKIKFSKCKYPEVILQEVESIDGVLTQENASKRFISTHLPYINKNSQWRMVQLNSDFSILSLLRNSYAIKYSDLLRIVRMAQATYTTIVLKTPEVEQNYPHPDFGIFAAPNCEDKIFIGPYFYYESYDVSTLRYVNRVLVKTELFNQMKGKAPTNNGCWLKQVQGQQVHKKNLQTIDLTLCDSDNETEFIETQTQEVRVKYIPSPRSLLKHPLNVSSNKEEEVSVNNLPVSNTEVIQEEPSNEKSIFTIDDVANFEMSAVDFEVKESSGDCVLEEDNAVNVRSLENQLYLVPNVPLMGYILAHKLRTITIVRWPTLNNAKRFYKIEEAVSWLEKELSDYFIVPPNFRITIKVKTELTPGVSDPFDPKYLKGYYLATKYGVKNLLNINLQTLKVLEVTSKELEVLARRRAKKMIYDKCCEIAKQFIPSETLKAKSCSEVIDMITTEIKMQRRAENFYIDKQQKLLTKKEKLVNSLSSVIKDISPYVSNKTQSAMLDILKRHKVPQTDEPPPEKSSDVVCITIDSDDEAPTDVIEKVPPKLAETPAAIIPKITVRNLHDLRDPNLNKPPDNGNTVIVTKQKKSDVLKALRVNPTGSNTINFDRKLEKINLYPLTKQTIKNFTQDGVKENSVVLPATTMSEDIVTVRPEPKGVKRKLQPIFPTISKCIIKTPTGKLIRVNAEQLKNIQNKGIILAPVTKEINPPDNGMTVFTNHSSHGGFVKINLDEALRKASEISNVQPSSSS